MKVICEICKTEFEAKRSTAKFCKPACRQKSKRIARGQKSKHICIICGNEFNTSQGGRKYCSDDCSEVARAQDEMYNNTRRSSLYYDDIGAGY